MNSRLALPLLLACFACEAPESYSPASTESSLAVATEVVVDEVSGRGVPGAFVELVGTQYSTYADLRGHFSIKRVDGFEWLRVTADGYGARTTRVGTQPRLFPTDLSDEAADRVLRQRRLRDMDSDDLFDPDLRPEAVAYLQARRENPDSLVPPGVPVLKGNALEPPATIRIYRRGPENNSCQGRVDVLPLEEYVRGVVPHEWIPSWHQQSLRAGAVAARGYAWGWINRGGKYDCADLDDTTRSQVYRDDRDARGDEAVAATTGQGIVRNGEFIPSEYSAENADPTEFGVAEPLCTGRERFGHGRGMCQWGTQRWATQRDQDYVWMVEHYFPGATVSTPTPPTPNLSMRQRLARVEPFACADPAGTFDCADFVREGRSFDLFDLWRGHSMRLTIEVTNEGGAASPADTQLNVNVNQNLTVTDVDVRNDGRNVTEGARLELFLGEIGPGDTASVVLTLRGDGYSVPSGSPARVRSWMRRVGDFYDKPEWGGDPAVNDGQSFNGGNLRAQAEMDVFDPARWTWAGGDPALLEGWAAHLSVANLTADNGLRVQASGASPTVDSPWAPIDGDRFGAVRVVSGRTGTVYWRAPGQQFSDERSAPIEGDIAVLRGKPGWGGGLEQLRIALDGAGDATITEVALQEQVDMPEDPDVPLDPEDMGVGGQGGVGGQPGPGGQGGEPGPGGQGGQSGPGGQGGEPNPGFGGQGGEPERFDAGPVRLPPQTSAARQQSDCNSVDAGGISWLLLGLLAVRRRR